jgi:AraC family transcriptional regulator
MERRLCQGSFCGEVLKRREVAGFILTETRYPPRLSIPRHSHENGYICFVRQGAYTEDYGRRTRSCQPLTVAIHPSDEIHSERFLNREARSFNIEPNRAWLERIRPYSSALDGPAEFQGGAMAALAVKLYREFINLDDVSPLALEGIMLEMIAEATRRQAPATSQPPRFLARARELMHARFAESLSVAEIARSAGVHPVYLATAFRARFHCTIGEYLRRLRVEAACRALAADEAPLAEIALAAGFAHQSHLSRVFKRHTGLTPGRYRDALRAR